MADVLFNIAKGRAGQLHERVNDNFPSTAVLTIVAIITTDTDALIRDVDTLADLLALSNTAEVTNSGYSRIILTDTDMAALDVNLISQESRAYPTSDPKFVGVSSGDVWTHIVFCFDESGNDTDATMVPLTMHDFVPTLNGGDISIQTSSGWWQTMYDSGA